MRVYKYLTAERFSRYLENYLSGELFFSNWHVFNDKKEGKYIWEEKNSSRLNDEIAKKLKEELRISKNGYTICSTAKLSGIFRMWDMYADHHKGVCIGIDVNEKNLETTIQKVEVKYLEKIPSYSTFSINRNNSDKKARDILSCKLQCWKQEKEIRFIWDSKKQGMHQIGDFVEIILGSNFVDNELYQQLIEIKENRMGFKIKHAFVSMDLYN
jgi:hypothetical protein